MDLHFDLFRAILYVKISNFHANSKSIRNKLEVLHSLFYRSELFAEGFFFLLYFVDLCFLLNGNMPPIVFNCLFHHSHRNLL